jgi:hypothetical protein
VDPGPDEYLRFLPIEQGAIPTLFNIVLDGLIAWGLFGSASAVPPWGESSVGVDLLATGSFPVLWFVVFEAVWAGMLALLVTPVR